MMASDRTVAGLPANTVDIRPSSQNCSASHLSFSTFCIFFFLLRPSDLHIVVDLQRSFHLAGMHSFSSHGRPVLCLLLDMRQFSTVLLITVLLWTTCRDLCYSLLTCSLLPSYLLHISTAFLYIVHFNLYHQYFGSLTW